jgi:hypothetical protein
LKSRLSALVVSSIVAGATPVLAQDSQYWSIQYGPVGQLLGGQVVGSSRDLSSTFYNPGGLALGDNPDFLLSVQAFQREAFTLKPLEGGRFLDTTVSRIDTFPGFFGVALPRSWLGEDTRLAVSVLTRQDNSMRLDQRFAGSVPAGDGHYGMETLFTQDMDETWGGLTLSRRLSDRIGLGATLYGVYRSQQTRREQSLQTSFANRTGVTAFVVDDFGYEHWRVLGKLGLAWDSDSLGLGVSLTTPSAGLFGSGSAGLTRSATGVDLNGDGQPDQLFLNGLDENLDATYKSSWAFAAGVAWRWRSLQLHASGEYFAPVTRFTILSGQSPASDGSPIVLAQELKGVLNAGIGVEYWLGGASAKATGSTEGTVLYSAFATDFTASPAVVGNEAAKSNMDLYHVTAGTAFSVWSNRFSLGVEWSFGSHTRDFSFGGLPASVPIIGEAHPIAVHYSRWVLVLGYQFGRAN